MISYKYYYLEKFVPSVSSCYFHMHSRFWTQGYQRFQNNLIGWCIIYLPKSVYNSCNENCFHPCEWFSNTTSNSTTKRKIAKSWQVFLKFISPTIRIKSIWLWKIKWITVHYILTH